MSADDGFLSRWSRRKSAERDGRPQPDAPPDVRQPGAASEQGTQPVASADTAVARVGDRPAAESTVPGTAPGDSGSTARLSTPGEAGKEAPPLPTLDDVAPLTPASDFRPFMRSGVDPAVRNAALKKMFVDPRFNVIDEMDIDIMDYNQLEPLPASMLKRMAQAHSLGLFRDEDAPPQAEASADADLPCPPTAADGAELREPTPTDEDPDLRLQPDDAAGCPGDRPGPGPLGGHEH